jgi:hypothetical protein
VWYWSRDLNAFRCTAAEIVMVQMSGSENLKRIFK